MFLVVPGIIETAMSPVSMPPALAPAPMLSTVSEPPVPNVTEAPTPETTNVPAAAPSPPNVTAAAPPSKPNNACHSRQSLSVSLLVGLFILFL